MENNEPIYKWRTAAKFDIGSVARFSDYEHGPFAYGVLTRIDDIDVQIGDGDEQGVTFYFADFGKANELVRYPQEEYKFCWIQYDANQEP